MISVLLIIYLHVILLKEANMNTQTNAKSTLMWKIQYRQNLFYFLEIPQTKNQNIFALLELWLKIWRLKVVQINCDVCVLLFIITFMP